MRRKRSADEGARSRSRKQARYLLGLLVAGVLWLAGGPAQAEADTVAQGDPNDNCLMCHGDPDFIGRFQDGELISLTIDRDEYQRSVHGPAGLNCVACHTALTRYPHHDEQQICIACHPEEGGQPGTEYAPLHVELSFEDRREMVLTINEACRSCHLHEFEVAVDSAHVRVMEGGNEAAPVCVDCHGGHGMVQFASRPRAEVSDMCGSCHKAVYSTYRTSVHGAALEDESNLDVPGCIECHGVHSVRGPRDAPYRNDSIGICGGCHSDPEMMAKYGLHTEVFDTYLDDFHGRTVNLFRGHSETAQSHKAVCFDCHGIHNIRRTDDALSTVYPSNLQHTCQQCHEDASIQFPSAWLSHYMPAWEHTPALVVVNTAYQILVPVVIGGFMAYISLDANRRWRDKRREKRRLRALLEKELEDYELGDKIRH